MYARRESLLMIIVCLTLSACDRDKPPSKFTGIEGREMFKLTASDGEAREVGRAMAVSGNIAIVWASFTDTDAGEDAGAAYVFDINTGEQLFKLTASDATEEGRFGASVAISGNTAIVGAHGRYLAPFDSGAAYLFDITTGELLLELTPSGGARDDEFGGRVAISGNIAIVGADGDDDAAEDSGAAYIFDVTTGEELLKLKAADAGEGDHFGLPVAVSGGVAIIGATLDDGVAESAGAAYLFDVATGEQLFKLTASDGARGDWFGGSVAINDNIAVVGSVGSAIFFGGSGAAYVFDITTGEELFKLTAANARIFGQSVAISGDIAIVGAPAFGSHGSACLFDVTTGELLLVLPAPARGDEFGQSVALSGNVAVVGASGADRPEGETVARGAAYVFELLIPAADEPVEAGPADEGNAQEGPTDRPVAGVVRGRGVASQGVPVRRSAVAAGLQQGRARAPGNVDHPLRGRRPFRPLRSRK